MTAELTAAERAAHREAGAAWLDMSSSTSRARITAVTGLASSGDDQQQHPYE